MCNKINKNFYNITYYRKLNTNLDELSEEIADLEISKVEQSDLETEVADQLDGMKVTIVQEVLAQLGSDSNSVFGKVNEDGIITITTDLASGDYTLMYENENGTLTEVGTITVSEVSTYYSITRTLTSCTSNNNETTIEDGSSWTETLIANSGYELSTVTVKMGGVDVTASVYSNGIINISEVTGDIEITATATEIVEEAYTNLFDTSGNGFSDQTTKFLTNWIPYNQADNGGTGTIYHFKGLAVPSYPNPYKMSFAKDTNGTDASTQSYCSNANVQSVTNASYDSSVMIVQHNTNSTLYKYVQFEIREAVPDNLIISANKDIIDESTDEPIVNPDEPSGNYTNLADTTSSDWLVDTRLSSSGATKSSTGAVTTNYIACKENDVLRIKGLNMKTVLPDGINYPSVCVYDTSKVKTGVFYPQSTHSSVFVESNGVVSYTLAVYNNNVQTGINIAFIRICGKPIDGESVIITLNEEIS